MRKIIAFLLLSTPLQVLHAANLLACGDPVCSLGGSAGSSSGVGILLALGLVVGAVVVGPRILRTLTPKRSHRG